jgi:hypothetical protein
MNRLFAVSLLAFGVLLAVGCKSKEQQLVGTWLATGTNVSQSELTLNSDKTFTTAGNTFAGTWSFAENTVTLNVQTVQGKPKEEALKEAEDQMGQMGMTGQQKEQAMQMTRAVLDDMKLAVSEDAKTMTMTVAGQTATFTKKA